MNGTSTLTAAQRGVIRLLRAGNRLGWKHAESCPRWFDGGGSARERAARRVYYSTVRPLLDGGYIEFPSNPRGDTLTRFAVLLPNAESVQ